MAKKGVKLTIEHKNKIGDALMIRKRITSTNDLTVVSLALHGSEGVKRVPYTAHGQPNQADGISS